MEKPLLSESGKFGAVIGVVVFRFHPYTVD
jgi:hypothetical protein